MSSRIRSASFSPEMIHPSIPYFIEPIQHHHSFVGLISSVDKCFCNTSVITMEAMQINRLTRTFLRKLIHSKKAGLQILDTSRISASYTVFPLLLFITSPVGYFIILHICVKLNT